MVDIYKIIVVKTGDVLKVVYNQREADIFISAIHKYGKLKIKKEQWNCKTNL